MMGQYTMCPVCRQAYDSASIHMCQGYPRDRYTQEYGHTHGHSPQVEALQDTVKHLQVQVDDMKRQLLEMEDRLRIMEFDKT